MPPPTSAAKVQTCFDERCREPGLAREVQVGVTGEDAQGLERKREAVRAALDANRPPAAAPLRCVQSVGGLEFAGLAGAMLGAAAARRPILLDGFATGVAALAPCRLEPALRDYLIAGRTPKRG